MKKLSLKHLFTGQILVFFDSFYQALRSGELQYVWLLSMGVSMLFSGCSGPTQPGQTHCNIRKLYGSYFQNDSIVNVYDINNRVVQSIFYTDGDTFSTTLDYYNNQVILNHYENGFLGGQTTAFLNSFGFPEIIYDSNNDTSHYFTYLSMEYL